MTTVLQLAVTAARVMPGWSAASEDDRVYLNGPDGERLLVEHDWPDNSRVSVTGILARHRRARHVITVRMDRGGGVLAREIRRRLLPGYLPALAADRAAFRAEQVQTAARHAVRDQLMAVLGPAGSLTGHCQTDSRSEVHVSLPEYRGGHLRLWSDGSVVEFERFQVPADMAVAMVALLGAAPKPNEHRESS